VTSTRSRAKRYRSTDRITKKAEFARCQNQGKRYASRRFVVLHFRKEAGPTRLGVIVTRKTGGAVVRNRWKRVIRDLFRLERERFPLGGDEVVIVKASVRGRPDRSSREELRTLLSKVTA
jgi:ribonuclease P protein component